MSMLRERNGKLSSTRCIATAIVVNALALMWSAAYVGNWDITHLIVLELLTLAGALYGVNKLSQPKEPMNES